MKWKVKQKLIGLACIALGIITPILMGEGTLSILIIPLGIGLILAKGKWIID